MAMLWARRTGMDKLFHHIFRFRRQVFLDSGSGHGVAVIRISSLLVLLADCGGPRVAIMSFWIGSTRGTFWITFGPVPVTFLAHEGWRSLVTRELELSKDSDTPARFDVLAGSFVSVHVGFYSAWRGRVGNGHSTRGIGSLGVRVRVRPYSEMMRGDGSPYERPSISCLKHKTPQYKPHNSAACRSLTQEEVFARFGNPNHTETTMTGSRPTPDAGPTLPTDEVHRMFEELKSDFGSHKNEFGSLKNEFGSLRSELGSKVDTTQQNFQDLSVQVAKDREI
ncbi:hypothetical protein ACLB2K_038169 [Fragaria x ananassa]